MDTVTYHSTNAKPDSVWMAYVIMPNGQRWNVPSYGATEKEAVDKIVALWESERAKVKTWDDPDVPYVQRYGRADRIHHLAGLVWVIHKETREKRRLPASEADALMAFGEWERGGPRSK